MNIKKGTEKFNKLLKMLEHLNHCVLKKHKAAFVDSVRGYAIKWENVSHKQFEAIEVIYNENL